jgi:hypothetical protein
MKTREQFTVLVVSKIKLKNNNIQRMKTREQQHTENEKYGTVYSSCCFENQTKKQQHTENEN